MIVLINIFWIVFAFCSMELVAWLAHKYVMHGLLWSVHKDHHVRTGKKFERNDLFALIFAIPSWLFIMFGVIDGADYKLYIGIGIFIYGVVYVVIHELFIHQRKSFLTNTQNTYLLALRRAHKMHHRHLDRHDGECFGMLLVPKKYFREARILKYGKS